MESDDKQALYAYLYEIVGEAGCGVSCSEAQIFKQDGQWQLFLEGFMGPWALGSTVDEAKANLRDYAAQGFGLG